MINHWLTETALVLMGLLFGGCFIGMVHSWPKFFPDGFNLRNLSWFVGVAILTILPIPWFYLWRNELKRKEKEKIRQDWQGIIEDAHKSELLVRFFRWIRCRRRGR